MKKYLEVKNLCYSHYKQPLCLKDVSFDMQKNETLIVVGHDEMGKTTLLNCVSGFDSRYFGSVELEGVEVKNIPDEDKGFSILYEEPILINGTIEKNLDLFAKHLELLKKRKKNRRFLKSLRFHKTSKLGLKNFLMQKRLNLILLDYI